MREENFGDVRNILPVKEQEVEIPCRVFRGKGGVIKKSITPTPSEDF